MSVHLYVYAFNHYYSYTYILIYAYIHLCLHIYAHIYLPLGRISPQKLFVTIPAHFMGCVVGTVLFKTFCPIVSYKVSEFVNVYYFINIYTVLCCVIVCCVIHVCCVLLFKTF